MTRQGMLAAIAAAALFISPAAVLASNCNGTSTGMIPLTDLGAGLYQGFQGGLYAGGSNHRPDAHNAAGVGIANSIVPLDTLGNPDPSNGRIVLISIGMSNATQEFSTFVPKATADPLKNPRVVAIDCAEGGQATNDIRYPDAPYWDFVATRLRTHGSAPLQAQVVWLKEARRGPTEGFPAAADSLRNDLGTIVRLIKDKLPNVRLCYLTSRIYAGYASSLLNPEPYAYESGFSVKWLVDAQINGAASLNYDPNAGPVEAPWLSWGPYLWADGLVGRSDSLKWHCDDFQTDGTHPSTSGRELVADSLLRFFRADETTKPWYLSGQLSVPGPPLGSEFRLALSPNPARGEVAFSFTPEAQREWRLEILDPSGRRVRELARGVGGPGAVSLRWDGRDATGAQVRSGIFWVRVTSGERQESRRFTFVRGG